MNCLSSAFIGRRLSHRLTPDEFSPSSLGRSVALLSWEHLCTDLESEGGRGQDPAGNKHQTEKVSCDCVWVNF